MGNAILAGALALMLAAVTVADLRTRLIPDRVLAPAALVAVAITALAEPQTLPERAAAGAGAGGFLLAAALIRPGGMGMGDVKLAAVLGLYLGRAVMPALLIALLAGAAWGAALIVRDGGEARSRAIPFGPFLGLGALAALPASPLT